MIVDITNFKLLVLDIAKNEAIQTLSIIIIVLISTLLLIELFGDTEKQDIDQENRDWSSKNDNIDEDF